MCVHRASFPKVKRINCTKLAKYLWNLHTFTKSSILLNAK